jgi:NitT/TauT family transport system permease protein
VSAPRGKKWLALSNDDTRSQTDRDNARESGGLRGSIRELVEAWQETGAWLKGVRAETWIVLGLIVGLLVFWEWLAGQYPEAIIPSIGETADALFKMMQDPRRDYFIAVGSTVQIYYSGLGLALVLGWSVAALMGRVPLFGRVMKVILDFFANIPIIAFMPLFVALLGLGPLAKIVVVLLAAFIVITTTAQAAFEGVGKSDEEAAMGLGASRLQAQVRVVWPQVLPQMIAGLRLGAAQALTACIIAEIYTAMTGLGGLLVGYGASFNMPRYFVTVLTALVIGSATSAVLRRFERHFSIP